MERITRCRARIAISDNGQVRTPGLCFWIMCWVALYLFKLFSLDGWKGVNGSVSNKHIRKHSLNCWKGMNGSVALVFNMNSILCLKMWFMCFVCFVASPYVFQW